MNGARSIFMRKGYWLTALAARCCWRRLLGRRWRRSTVTGPASEHGDRGRHRHVYRGGQGICPAAGGRAVILP